MGYCVTSDVGGGDYRVNLSWSFHFPGFAQIERKVFIELFVEPVMGEGINDLLILGQYQSFDDLSLGSPLMPGHACQCQCTPGRYPGIDTAFTVAICSRKGTF